MPGGTGPIRAESASHDPNQPSGRPPQRWAAVCIHYNGVSPEFPNPQLHASATFDYGAYYEEARVLKQLSERFELCMFGLNMVRRELDGLRDPQLQAVKRLLGE